MGSSNTNKWNETRERSNVLYTHACTHTYWLTVYVAHIQSMVASVGLFNMRSYCGYMKWEHFIMKFIERFRMLPDYNTHRYKFYLNRSSISKQRHSKSFLACNPKTPFWNPAPIPEKSRFRAFPNFFQERISLTVYIFSSNFWVCLLKKDIT